MTRYSEEREEYLRRRRMGPIRRIVNDWWDRLVGAAHDGSLADQDEEYASGRTSRDFMWNSIGLGAWGMVFPLLTIVVTQLVGVERAGMFSLAFVTANLLYILGCYGVRTYQVSDLDEFHGFWDYQAGRILTCAAMLLAGFVYFTVRGYAGEMWLMSFGILVFKTIDALGDVYEGRLQQVDKLYLGGISITIRSAAALVIFTIVLLVTGDLGFASVGMAIAGAASFACVTFPLTLLESPRSMSLSVRSVKYLLQECAPVFLALFLYALIDNLPKFMMEGSLSYDNQLFFNALYFPAQMILMIIGLVYKPLLVRMANLWADESRRRKFDYVIIAIGVLIVIVTLISIGFMAWIGIPIMSLLYGVDFEPYRQLSYIMLVAGGITAGIDFLYQVVTILRRQRAVIGLYLITFVFSIIVLMLMINMVGLRGAAIGYLLVMLVLFVLLLREYIVQRRGFSRGRRVR